MKHHTFAWISLLSAALAAGWGTPAFAAPQSAEQVPLQLDVGGRFNVVGTGEQLIDPFKSDGRIYLFQNHARLWLDAHENGYRFYSQVALGGEDLVVAPNPGIGLSLLDMNAEIPIPLLASTLKVGQFKVPYGREQLTDSATLDFNSRSIANLGFQTGRDVGLALEKKLGPVLAAGGVFTGGGRDVPQEFIPEVLGIPMLALRAGVGELAADPFMPSPHDLSADHTAMGAAFNGLYMRDSKIGHSTILNVKSTDDSLLTNINWNPYLARSPFAQGDLYQLGLDWALRTPWLGRILSAEAEINEGGYSNTYGSLHLAAGRAQVALNQKPYELALRYAVLFPDANFALYDPATSKSYPITGSRPIQELTPSVSTFLWGDQLKLVLDLPILIDVPVVTENNVGSYVATDMPNQTTPLKSGAAIARQLVVQARLGLQCGF